MEYTWRYGRILITYRIVSKVTDIAQEIDDENYTHTHTHTCTLVLVKMENLANCLTIENNKKVYLPWKRSNWGKPLVSKPHHMRSTIEICLLACNVSWALIWLVANQKYTKAI